MQQYRPTQLRLDVQIYNRSQKLEIPTTGSWLEQASGWFTAASDQLPAGPKRGDKKGKAVVQECACSTSAFIILTPEVKFVQWFWNHQWCNFVIFISARQTAVERDWLSDSNFENPKIISRVRLKILRHKSYCTSCHKWLLSVTLPLTNQRKSS